jgi:hypothetical protein
MVDEEGKKRQSPPRKQDPPPAQPAQPAKQARQPLDPAMLSSIEKSIFLDVGEKGVLLFRMADGKTTINQATSALGMTQEGMADIVEKLKSKYIFLEFEETKKEQVLIEKKAEPTPLDVPRKVSEDSLTSLTLGSELAIRFGPAGKKIYDVIDGKLDTVQVAVEALVPLDFVDDVIWFLSERKQLHFAKLRTDDIKTKYGSIGLRIFNEYGRDGIFIYVLLQRLADPLPTIRLSGIDEVKALDIYEFIHKTANLPFPFNKKDMLTMLKR